MESSLAQQPTPTDGSDIHSSHTRAQCLRSQVQVELQHLHQEMSLVLQQQTQQKDLTQFLFELRQDVEKDLSWYLPLYKAAIIGDWKTAKRFLENHPDAVTARITICKDTALHVAATGRSICFMKKLMKLMSKDDLALKNDFGHTALHLTAGVGNIVAVKSLVMRNPALPNTWNEFKQLPLHVAASIGHKDVILFLLTVTNKDMEPKPFEGESGSSLVVSLITSGLSGVALHILKEYPNLAVVDEDCSPWHTIAKKASAFPSGSHLNFWQHLIYTCVPLKSEKFPNFRNAENPTDTSQVQGQHNIRDGEDVENPTDSSQVQGQVCCRFPLFQGNHFISVFQKLNAGLWNVIDLLVPHIKHIRDKKLMHQQTQQLAKYCCEQIIRLHNDKDLMSMLISPFLSAIELGIHEIVEVILASYPAVAISFIDRALNLAVINRREKVFNLISQMGVFNVIIHMGEFKFSLTTDNNQNNILHLAGKLAPLHRRNLVSGAALQMQRELQWFKEVENFVLPLHKESTNKDGMTPRMVFTAEHEALVKEGEQWMKDRANSCTIVSALVATVVFAAAITVPGNYGNDGVPIFSKDKWFVTFAISDAISLFSSLSSVMMFLSILTSRYAEDDFLYALPRRLIIGLITLFVSIISLVVAFSATLYIVFAHKKPWVLIPVGAMACLPITLFMFLQFPLLVDMMKSTCGSAFFRSKVKGSCYRSNVMRVLMVYHRYFESIISPNPK